MQSHDRTGAFHIGPGEGETVSVRGEFAITFKVPGRVTNGALAVVERTLRPGVLGEPLHRHRREDVTSYITEGELTVQVDDDVVTLGPRSFIVKPRGSWHACWNGGIEPVRFLEVFAPAGFEDLFREMPRYLSDDDGFDLDALARRAEEYGVEVDLDSLPELLERHGVRWTA